MEPLVANHQLLSARPSGGRASLLMEDVPIDADGMTSWTSRVYENDVAGPVNELLDNCRDHFRSSFSHRLQEGCLPVHIKVDTEEGKLVLTNPATDIPSITTVLTFAKSTKTGGMEDQSGENGVGLIQAANALGEGLLVCVYEHGVLSFGYQKDMKCLSGSLPYSVWDQLVKKGGVYAASSLFPEHQHSLKTCCTIKQLLGNRMTLEEALTATLPTANDFAPGKGKFSVTILHLRKPQAVLVHLRAVLRELYLGYINICWTIHASPISVSTHHRSKVWTSRLLCMTKYTLEDGPAKGVNVYIGFDPGLIEKVDGKYLHSNRMYIYSSGRLVKRINDFRTYCKLSATGSLYQSGMTVIIDERRANQTLRVFQPTPTKEELKNLTTVLSDLHELHAFVRLYYGYWKQRIAPRKLEAFHAAIYMGKWALGDVGSPREPTDIALCDLNEFPPRRYKSGNAGWVQTYNAGRDQRRYIEHPHGNNFVNIQFTNKKIDSDVSESASTEASVVEETSSESDEEAHSESDEEAHSESGEAPSSESDEDTSSESSSSDFWLLGTDRNTAKRSDTAQDQMSKGRRCSHCEKAQKQIQVLKSDITKSREELRETRRTLARSRTEVRALKDKVAELRSEVERYKVGPSQKRLREDESPDPGASKKAKTQANRKATADLCGEIKPNYTGNERLDRLIYLDHIITCQLEHHDAYASLGVVEGWCQLPFVKKKMRKLRILLQREQFNIKLGYRCRGCQKFYQKVWTSCPGCKYVERKKRKCSWHVKPPQKAIIERIRFELKTHRRDYNEKITKLKKQAAVNTNTHDTRYSAAGYPLASTSCATTASAKQTTSDAIPRFPLLEQEEHNVASSANSVTTTTNHARMTESKQSGDRELTPSASSDEDIPFEIVETASPVHLGLHSAKNLDNGQAPVISDTTRRTYILHL